VGFEREGVMREAIMYTGGRDDMVVYGLLRKGM
jgi:RimJ/RimL family protein N-acetyltransferase